MVSRPFLFGFGNEKSTGCILGKSCGHTIYWGLGDRYDTGDISNNPVDINLENFCDIRFKSQFTRI